MEIQAKEDQVKLAEELLGVQFPNSYKARLLKEGIGNVNSTLSDWEMFALPGTRASGQESQASDDLITGNKDAQGWHHFPAGAIAIAGNDCGDYLVLLPLGEGSQELSECVYYWWHATGELFPLAQATEGSAVIDEGGIWSGNHNSVDSQTMNKELLHEAHVDVAEHILNVKFPAIYRELLLSDRCGEHCTPWDLFPELKPLPTESEDGIEDGLALIHFIEKMTSQAIESWEEFPQEGLAIAENRCGDTLVLLPTGLNNEGVMEFEETLFVFDHSDFTLYTEAETLEEFFQLPNQELNG